MFKDIDINEYIGKRYDEKGGDGINSFNCATLYRTITGVDASIIPTCESGNTLDIVKAIKENRRHYREIKKPYNGCIVALSQLRKPHHIGVYINDSVLHCTKGIGVVYSSFFNLKENGYTWEFGELING